MLRSTLSALFLASLPLLSPAASLGTAFSYQGRLNSNGLPLTGLCDLRFGLYDALAGGNLVGNLLTNSLTPVTNGIFTATLDFGPAAFAGNARWLDTAVRSFGEPSFTPLLPRQPLTPVPSPSSGERGTATHGAERS